MLSPIEKALDSIVDILEWCKANKCDVDHQTFLNACNEAYCITWRAIFPNGRYSAAAMNGGVVSLELSCALLSTAGISVFVPLFIIQSRLPGAAQYRALTNQE